MPQVRRRDPREQPRLRLLVVEEPQGAGLRLRDLEVDQGPPISADEARQVIEQGVRLDGLQGPQGPVPRPPGAAADKTVEVSARTGRGTEPPPPGDRPPRRRVSVVCPSPGGGHARCHRRRTQAVARADVRSIGAASASSTGSTRDATGQAEFAPSRRHPWISHFVPPRAPSGGRGREVAFAEDACWPPQGQGRRAPDRGEEHRVRPSGWRLRRRPSPATALRG